MHKLISCKVYEEDRLYHLIDTGKPFQRQLMKDNAGFLEVGGISVHRGDHHYSPEKGNGWVGQFENEELVFEFIRCLRGQNVEVIDVTNKEM